MHDYYSSHVHQSHMQSSVPNSITPPHQIHNPTPSYPIHSNITTLSSSPASYHTTTATGVSSSSLLTDSHHNMNRSDSPISNPYSSSMNLPPTPNSLVTMIGPNSNNSNSNDASTAPTDGMESGLNSISASHSSLGHNNPYSPWTSAPPRAPLSPPDSASSGSLLQPIPTSASNTQLHHLTAPSLQHSNASAASFMPQSLHSFAHHPSATKNFSMPQPYYSWY